MNASENVKFGDCVVHGEWEPFGAPCVNTMVSSSSSTAVDSVSTIVSPCSSVLVANSIGTRAWNYHSLSSASLGFNESDILCDANAPNCTGKVLPSIPRTLPPNWALDTGAGLSGFGGGNLGGMNIAYGPNSYISLYEGMTGLQPQKTELKMRETNADHGSTKEGSTKNQINQENFRVSVFSHGFHEVSLAKCSQEGNSNSVDVPTDSSPSDNGAKKRKITSQDLEAEQRSSRSSFEATKDKTEYKQKAGEDSTKPDCSEGLKGDYIHVRARRGQATNSHSLAERVRREKISERMKYLQDLVPGCSKVTGKAVMLDEIINYVQSLQKQVEFLSMKLAVVNPRLEFSIEDILAKDVLHSGAGPSVIGFPHEIIHPQFCLTQPGVAQAGISGMANPYNVFRRTLNSQLTMVGGYKDPLLQVHNPWDNSLQNAMTSTYEGSNPFSTQVLNGKPQDSFPM